MGLLDTIKSSTKVAGIFLEKHSPEILVTTGLIGMAGAIILAHKAALKTEDELHNTNAFEEFEKCGKKEKAKIFVKNYAPVAIAFVGSSACILGGFNILRNRYAMSLALVSATTQAYETYRKRIKEKYGEEADQYGMYGVETETITVKDGETGKKEKIQRQVIRVTNGDLASPFAVLFAPFDYEHRSGSKYYENDKVYNENMLQIIENGFVTKYEAGEPIFLSDVYKALGFDIEDLLETRGDAIQKMGWWKGHEPECSDGYFSLRLSQVFNKPDPGYGPEVETVCWIVDPNVPGVIV